MEVPGLGVELQLQLLAYATATQKRRIQAAFATYTIAHGNTGWIPDQLSKARDRTCAFMDTSWVCYH